MKVNNSILAFIPKYQRRGQQKDQNFCKFMLGLRKLLILSNCNDLLREEHNTITPNKDCQHMAVHCFARPLDEVHRILIDKQGTKSITNEVNIRKFRNNLADVIEKSITSHLTEDMTYKDIVRKSEPLKALNRVSNGKHTKAGYSRQVCKHTNAINSPSSYWTQQPRPGKRQPHQNCQTIPEAGSTASAGSKNSDWDKIKKTLSVKEHMSRIHEQSSLGYRLEAHNCKDCRKRLN